MMHISKVVDLTDSKGIGRIIEVVNMEVEEVPEGVSLEAEIIDHVVKMVFKILLSIKGRLIAMGFVNLPNYNCYPNPHRLQ